MKKISLWLGLAVLVLLTFSACSGGQATAPQNGEASEAANTLQTYLTALVEKDEALLTSLVCPDYELDALLEYDSFQAVQTKLTGLACQQTGTEGDTILVTCQGKIDATYGNEVQSFDLGGRTYKLVKSGADWQVCGYNLQ